MNLKLTHYMNVTQLIKSRQKIWARNCSVLKSRFAPPRITFTPLSACSFLPLTPSFVLFLSYHLANLISCLAFLLLVLMQLLFDLINDAVLLLPTTTLRLLIIIPAAAAAAAVATTTAGGSADALLFKQAVSFAAGTGSGGVKVAAVGVQAARLDILLAGTLLIAAFVRTSFVDIVVDIFVVTARRGRSRIRSAIAGIAGVAAVFTCNGRDVTGTRPREFVVGCIIIACRGNIGWGATVERVAARSVLIFVGSNGSDLLLLLLIVVAVVVVVIVKDLV